VRAAFPGERPVSVRMSATDWVNGGWDIAQAIEIAKARAAAAVVLSTYPVEPQSRRNGSRWPRAPGYAGARGRLGAETGHPAAQATGGPCFRADVFALERGVQLDITGQHV